MCHKLYAVDPSSRLFTVDINTASAQLVGPVGISSVTDIANYKGQMYGITFNEFLLIDANTGHGVVVGPLGVSANGLAVDSQGNVYAGAGGDLVQIDPTTGAATVVGPFGGGLFSSGDLAFDSNDVLYGTLAGPGGDSIAQIDVNTGAATPVYTTGQSGLYGLAFCCCKLIVADQDGILYEVQLGTQTLIPVGKSGVNIWGITCGGCCK